MRASLIFILLFAVLSCNPVASSIEVNTASDKVSTAELQPTAKQQPMLLAEGHRKLEFLNRASREQVKWYSLGSNALEKARNDGKFIIAYFHASNCEYCEMQDKSFQDKSVVPLLNEHFIPMRIDADEHIFLYMQLFNQFELQNYFPTVIIIAPDGVPVASIQQPMTSENIVDMLNMLQEMLKVTTE